MCGDVCMDMYVCMHLYVNACVNVYVHACMCRSVHMGCVYV